MTKEARMVRVKQQILDLVFHEETDVQIGAIGLAIAEIMETKSFNHKLLTQYLDTHAEELKRRMN